MIRPCSVLPFTLVALLAACISTVETGPPPPYMPPMGPNPEAAERVLNTMKEKIAAAEELVVLREESLQNAENQFQLRFLVFSCGGRRTSFLGEHSRALDGRLGGLAHFVSLWQLRR